MSTGAIIFWIIIVIIVYIYLRRKNKIPKLFIFGLRGHRQRNLVINEDAIVEKWEQLLLGMGGKGEELLKSIASKFQELKMPDVTFARKEATLGKAEPFSGAKTREFVTMRHLRYPDYELWIGAIDRAGQLKVSWYITVALEGRVTATLRARNRASRDSMPGPLRILSILHEKSAKAVARKINQKISGNTSSYVRVRPEDMTMDDREELSAYITTAHQVVLAALEELMNGLNLDFSKVDKHTKGFLNLS